MKKLFSLSSILFLPLFSMAQFLIHYSDPGGDDVSFSAVVSYQPDRVLVMGNEGNKMVIVEIDTLGNVLSSHLITIVDETKTPICYEAVMDVEGMIAMVGFRGTVGDVATYNAFVMRYDPVNGTVLWVKEWEKVPKYYGALFTEITEADQAGFYEVSGSFSDIDNSQEGMIAVVNKVNGNLSIVALLDYAGSSDDFSSFLKVGNKIWTFGRNNLLGGGFSGMRPCISILSEGGIQLNSYAYLKPINKAARLYGTDLVLSANTIYAIIYGDNSGIELNKDLYLAALKKDGSLLYTHKLEFPTDFDGRLQCLTTSGEDQIIYGNQYDATAVNTSGKALLMRIKKNGSPAWVKSYPFTSSTTGSTPGSMIVMTDAADNNFIWAVGRMPDPATNHFAGCVLRVNAQDGSLGSCDKSEAMTIINEDNVSFPIVMNDETTNNKIVPRNSIVEESEMIAENSCPDSHPSEIVQRDDKTIGDKEWRLYPDPAEGELYIDGNISSSSLITISSLNGEIIRSIEAANHISVEDLLPGIYFISVLNDQQQWMHLKFVKE